MRSAAAFLLLPCAALLLAASDCDGGSGATTTVLPAPAEQPVYESGDLGIVPVYGTTTEARARFTLGPDELPLAVIAEGDYVPAGGGSATAELMIYDTKGDQDATNDVLVGAATGPGSFSRAQLSGENPGSFSIRIPLGTGCAHKAALLGGTWGARFRVNTTGWHGNVTTWKLRVVTLKGAQVRVQPDSFIRD